jgi:hypothetical protein
MRCSNRCELWLLVGINLVMFVAVRSARAGDMPSYAAPAVPATGALSGYQAPPELPYTAGEPIPLGYRVVEEPRAGLVLAGWLVSGIAYGASVMAAISANGKNASSYLFMPFLGPWFTLGRRDYASCGSADTADSGLHCVGDVFAVMGLVADGVIQATGAALLFSGYLAKRTKLVRGDLAWSIAPRPMGAGLGLAASGAF